MSDHHDGKLSSQCRSGDLLGQSAASTLLMTPAAPLCLAETFEQADAGASLTYPQQAGTIRKNAYIVINGHPCKVCSSVMGQRVFTGSREEQRRGRGAAHRAAMNRRYASAHGSELKQLSCSSVMAAERISSMGGLNCARHLQGRVSWLAPAKRFKRAPSALFRRSLMCLPRRPASTATPSATSWASTFSLARSMRT